MFTIIETDPICGRVVEASESAVTYTYAGWTYLFCCQECLEMFQKSPESCVIYLAHTRSAYVGHLCRYQRASSQPRLSVGVSSR
ncbi:MAG: YHS domain-containing protein [Caldilineaceae bacterium]|nr:YHS domain-containing protein [Caldilineaceae bacterium]